MGQRFTLAMSTALVAGLVLVSTGGAVSEAAGGGRSAGAGAQRVLNIVILGDSYSAGNGAWQTNGKPETRKYFGPVGCMRSPFNWGRQYRKELRSALGMKVTYVNHACSGATTSDISTPNVLDEWHAMPPMPSPPIPADEVTDYANDHHLCGQLKNYTDEQYVVASNGSAGDVRGVPVMTFTCRRYLRPQQDFLGLQTDLVLLTIGGNDIRFSEIVKRCFVPLFRDLSNSCVRLIRDADEELDRVRVRVESTITGLFEGSRLGPNARVVLVGYPLLAMANSGYELDDAPVADMVRAWGQRGEAMLGRVVSDINSDVGNPARGRVVFAGGIPLHFAGHEPNPSWGEGNPNGGWLHEFVEFGDFMMEDFHPNPLGHEQYMRHLFDHVADGDQGFGAGAARKPAGDVDLVFAVDATASMAPELAALKARLGSVLSSAAAEANTIRFALVSYREEPRFSGDPVDYASRLEQDFTEDPAEIVAALAGLDADGGGGTRETMLSGLMTGLDLDWREGVKKSVIAVSDNAPHDPEPSTRIDATDVVDRAWAVDPAAVSVVDTGQASDNAPALQVVTETAGRAFVVAEDQVDTGVADAIHDVLDRPHATITDPRVARVDSTIEIDGAGSYSPTGEIVSYQWDFDGDRVPDQTTNTPLVSHTFHQEISGDLALMATDASGRQSIAAQHLAITADGDEIPAEADNCPGEENMAQTDTDGDGLGDACDPTPAPPIPDDPVTPGRRGSTASLAPITR